MGTKISVVGLRAKAGVFLALLLVSAVVTISAQPGFAIPQPALHLHPQLLGLLPSSNQQPSGATDSNNRFIVRDTGGLLSLNLTCGLLGCNVLESLGDPGGQLFVVQSLGLVDPGTFLTQLLSAIGVVDAEPDQIVTTLGATIGTIPSYLTDEKPIWYYGAQVWEGYVLQTPNQIVRTSDAQSEFEVSGRGIIVALIDTGVDPNSTILGPHLIYGYDFTRNASGGSEMGDVTQSTAGVIDGSTQPAQLNQSTAGVIDNGSAQVINQAQYSAFGHGTMTAGIVHLVAPNARLMPLKAFHADGTGYASDVLRAIYYAVNHYAKVISMSFEFGSPSVELVNAINYATGRRVICVASAGNDGSMTVVYPSGLPNVIDVASTSNTDAPSTFSNYGTPPVWISAPGEAVMSTYPFNTYAVGWGTSFSAPFVSGTVALMASSNPWLSYFFLNQASAANALSNAQSINAPPVQQSQYGFGVLDIYQAVQAWSNQFDY
jgi:subtilisin family serine protease